MKLLSWGDVVLPQLFRQNLPIILFFELLGTKIQYILVTFPSLLLSLHLPPKHRDSVCSCFVKTNLCILVLIETFGFRLCERGEFRRTLNQEYHAFLLLGMSINCLVCQGHLPGNQFWRVGSIVHRFYYLKASPKGSSLERFLTLSKKEYHAF